MCFRNLDSMLRLLQVRPRDHEFLAASIYTALENVFKVIFMSLGSVIFSSENGVGEVDADLFCVSGRPRDQGGSADQHQRNVAGSTRCPCLTGSIVCFYGVYQFLYSALAGLMATWEFKCTPTRKVDVGGPGTLIGL